MLCSLRWALPLVMLIASMALAQPPVPPPVPPFAPQAQNVSPLPPAFPTAAPQVIPTPPPTAPNAIEMSKPFAPPNRIGNRSLTEWLVDFKSSDPTVREQATRVVQLFGIPAARSQASHSSLVRDCLPIPDSTEIAHRAVAPVPTNRRCGGRRMG